MLSVCMIVRDEAVLLPRALASVQRCATEIVVVDTGSTDNTVRLARSLGAKVLEKAWTHDFSAARNHSLQAATQDWILVLDADEVLVAEDIPALKEALHGTAEAFELVRRDFHRIAQQ